MRFCVLEIQDGGGILVDVGFGIFNHSYTSQDMGLGEAENTTSFTKLPFWDIWCRGFV